MKNLVCLAICMVMVSVAFPVGAQDTQSAFQKNGDSKSLEKRIQQLEAAVGSGAESDRWYDRIQISGLIEAEAVNQTVDVQGEDSETTADVDLATVELVVDAKIADHVDGHALFKWEGEEVFVDEGFITLSGPETFPGYLIAGRQYLPFGYFDSFFVSDPTTLVLGETNQGSVVAGYRFGGEMADIAIGAFNGEVSTVDADDTVDSFVAGIVSQPLEWLMVGASFTSNLASSDTFSEFVEEEIDSTVSGWSAFVTVEFLDRFKIIGEYVSALDSFEAGEVYAATGDTEDRQPSAWNLEFGAGITDSLELAIRYGGSNDGGTEFLPEIQYGAVLNWGLFDGTNLALEYMHDEFEDESQEVNALTAQLAVEF
jgi:hypothetical protein